MDFLEDKEKYLEDENIKLEQKKKELQKDIELNKSIKQEINDLIKKKADLENQIKGLENLNLQNRNLQNQNYQNMNNNYNRPNESSFNKSIGAKTLIYNIEKNKQQNQFNQIYNINQYNKINQNLINKNQINQNNNVNLNQINKIQTNQNNDANQNENRFNPNRNIIQNKKKKIKINPIDSYSIPPKIGLNNIGSTCFKNAVLQCFSQTEDLTNYFLRENSLQSILNNNIAKINQNSPQLSPAYYELIQNLWSKDKIQSFSPNNFMKIVEKMTEKDVLNFRSGDAGDSKDFIIFILEQFHKELQKNMSGANPKKLPPLNQYDKNNAFNFFFEDLKKGVSVISDIFFGFYETNTICLNCKNIYCSKGLMNPICYNYGIINCLIFPLEEVKKFKNKQLQTNNIIMNQNNIVNLYECFAFYEKEEYFTGENQNYCNICKQNSNAIYKTIIYSSPNVLILILNRGKGNIYNIKLDFNEFIDITQFVIMKDKPKITYNLYGVITHLGKSGPSAHFVASCKSPVDKKWYRYNDAFVTQIVNLEKEVINYGTPYILFYKKNK